MKVWKDYAIEDAVFIAKAVKTIKHQAVNSFWRKLCPDVVHDLTGFTTEPIKEVMNEILDLTAQKKKKK